MLLECMFSDEHRFDDLQDPSITKCQLSKSEFIPDTQKLNQALAFSPDSF